MIQGVSLNESEQLELIVEYTGKDSKRLAQSLHNGMPTSTIQGRG